jgi:hypothetical protein
MQHGEDDDVYTYSFSLDPGDHVPSGTWNYSRPCGYCWFIDDIAWCFACGKDLDIVRQNRRWSWLRAEWVGAVAAAAAGSR